ncbi:hypothetical protein ACKWTF_016261 [Chironomus riparius]
MWQKTIFLLISLQVALISSQERISCNYVQASPMYPYTCHLTINNPNGLDDFTEIAGFHIANRGNADVTFLSATFQNTRNIPSIICRQFPNIRELYMTASNIENIGESSFAGCDNLNQVTLVMNRINAIPDNTFRSNIHLTILNMAQNGIRVLGPNAFAGTRLTTIDLSFNEINMFSSATFAAVGQTLTSLLLIANSITSLPNGAFAGLRNLQNLHLSGNIFTNIPNNIFRELDNLMLLHVINCGLSQPNVDWFTDMRALKEIHMESNGIASLPDGLFARSRRLTNVYLAGNNLTQITGAPFGTSLPALEILSVSDNAIHGVDSRFFDVAENLNSLYLSGNTCSNENFQMTFDGRDGVRTRLERCFRGFGPEVIECRYELSGDLYACHMNIRNPVGNEFNSIGGTHVGGQGNNNVQTVDIIGGNTRNVPQIICQQFPQVSAMLIFDDFVDIINPQAFSTCRNLRQLHLGLNTIMEVPDNTFSNSPFLEELYLGSNFIVSIAPNAFAGTVLNFLDLSYNQLGALNAAWFAPVSSTLRVLDLINSRISSIPSDTFVGLTGLQDLFLNSNRLTGLNPDAFVPLVNLRDLSLSYCDLMELNPQWFRTLTNLTILSINRNGITELPENIFNALTRLDQLFFYENQIVNIRAESFGASLPSIGLLYGPQNLINSFDPEMLDRGTSLDILNFANNLCANFNQQGVRGDLDLARQNLAECTTNYAAPLTASCEYDRMITGRIYWCRMTLSNPLGRNDITTIEGDHLPASNDDQVALVEISGQNTRIIPSVMCRQFRSMQILEIIDSNLHEINEDGFQGCGFLRELTIMNNRIRSIPARAFVAATNLQVLVLASNGIEDISPYAFAQTNIQVLDLTHNNIGRFDPFTYTPIAGSLRILRLTDNNIRAIPENAFDRLSNLVDLELNGNQIPSIPHNAFFGAVNLQILQIANCRLERLEPATFSRLTFLRDLELALNQIDLLPDDIFDLPNLETLGLDGNNLRILDANAFGRSINSLMSIDASLNRITAFDPEMIRVNASINSINLSFNQCTDLSFTDIPLFRDEVLERLSGCISTFEETQLTCNYALESGTMYICELAINNPNDRLRFTDIAGTHMEGRNDNSVRFLTALEQNTRSIPALLCQRFRNIESLVFADSRVEAIAVEAFQNCNNLFSLNLAGNNIMLIPDNLFRGNPNLNILNLANNRIERLFPGLFQGTRIAALDIELNNFRTFDPAWLAPVAGNLMWLYLQNNQITRFPRNAFSSFTRLSLLEMSGNRDLFMPSDAFNGLSFLFILQMANCGINNLNHRWFDDLRDLTFLEIDSNGITELPVEIFNLPSLEHLGFAFNRVSRLDLRSFGGHAGEFVHIDAENNQINAIDRQFFVNARNLDTFLLAGNVCNNNNFIDVRQNRDNVMQILEPCFNNFNATA